MSLYIRKDSKYYWMLLERPELKPIQKSTRVLIDAPTQGQARDQRALAEQIYTVAMGELAKTGYQALIVDERPKILFKEFAPWYADNVLVHHRGATKERTTLRMLVTEFGELPLEAIDQTRVQEWLTRRTKRVEASTANRELDDLKLILARAVPKYLAASPLRGMRRLRTIEKEVVILTRDQYGLLLDTCETKEEEAIVVMAVNTLLRLGSLLQLKWIHDKGTYLDTLNAKVSQVLAAVPSAVREVLDDLPKTGEHILANDVGHRGGGPTARKNYIIRLFDRLCARAGIAHGRQAHGVTFHSLRHTGASFAMQNGATLAQVMKLGGWKTGTDVPPVCACTHAGRATGRRAHHEAPI